MSRERARWVGAGIAAAGSLLLGLLAARAVLADLRSGSQSLGILWLPLSLVVTGFVPATVLGWLLAPGALDGRRSVIRAGLRYGLLLIPAGAVQFGIVMLISIAASNREIGFNPGVGVAVLILVLLAGSVFVGPFMLVVTIPAAIIWVVLLRAVARAGSRGARSGRFTWARRVLRGADWLLGTWRVGVLVAVLVAVWAGSRWA